MILIIYDILSLYTIAFLFYNANQEDHPNNRAARYRAMKGLRMPRFPKPEAEFSTLAESLWRGLFDHATLYLFLLYPSSRKSPKTQRRKGTADGRS